MRRASIWIVLSLLLLAAVPAQEPTPTPPAPTWTPGPPLPKATSPLPTPVPSAAESPLKTPPVTTPTVSPVADDAPVVVWPLLGGGVIVLGAVLLAVRRWRTGSSHRG